MLQRDTFKKCRTHHKQMFVDVESLKSGIHDVMCVCLCVCVCAHVFVFVHVFVMYV